MDRKPVMVHWSLLFEFWCVPVDLYDHPDKESAFIHGLPSPTGLLDITRARLYGGFFCADHPDRVHVGYDTGAFTYTNPEMNTVLEPEERRAQYEKLIAKNATGSKFDMPVADRGPFCDDMPELCRVTKTEDE